MSNHGQEPEVDNSYWRGGYVGALLLIDGVVLLLYVVDLLRFSAIGISLKDAIRVAYEETMEATYLPMLAVGVLVFFVLGLPMVLALIVPLVWRSGPRPRLFRAGGRGVVGTHMILALIIACFTVTAFLMEALSGWAIMTNEEGHPVKYTFSAWWLGVVFLYKPISIAYISPIIRKFLVRKAIEPTTTHLGEVIKEVGTEEVPGQG